MNSYYYSPGSFLSPEQNLLRERGVAQGKAEYILKTLEDYGKVPLGIRERILHQTQSVQLERWFTLARQVRSIEEFINRM